MALPEKHLPSSCVKGYIQSAPCVTTDLSVNSLIPSPDKHLLNKAREEGNSPYSQGAFTLVEKADINKIITSCNMGH